MRQSTKIEERITHSPMILTSTRFLRLPSNGIIPSQRKYPHIPRTDQPASNTAKQCPIPRTGHIVSSSQSRHVRSPKQSTTKPTTVSSTPSSRAVIHRPWHEVHYQVFSRGKSKVSRGIGPLFQQWRTMGWAWARWAWAGCGFAGGGGVVIRKIGLPQTGARWSIICIVLGRYLVLLARVGGRLLEM